MPEVRIRTDFGAVAIPYNSIEELEKALLEIDKVVEIVNSKVGKIVKKKIRKPKPGYEDVYQFNDDNSISILKPGKNIENIGIVLFAFDPVPLAVEFISHCSDVKDAGSLLKLKYYKKYFQNVERGVYKLTSEGLKWVIDEVIPSVRGSRQEQAQE